ncbi:MAG: alpha/beta hydrolase [Methylococcales bacterium]
MNTKEDIKLKNTVVITTVHGTWAKNAKWTKEYSSTMSQLKEEVPDAVIDQFNWSGNNRQTSRLHTADELAIHIDSVQRKHGSNVDHFLVSHSHGGNVALQRAKIAHLPIA